ncbi:GNAT family N-acetyltransferase [Paractinoplanes toevensis]|uniref:Aminoglycoside 2'-N-acetyltransferase n=1 Tax=Paractinoplanes toevensis TaxID=571911 RepID=A0A919T5I9_9ACTN|nr:GNAT family N-acetyltransferase [Actinoplanes toevensis]GIM89430.1 aminoglycoside 2'-N-acetyltransferase [Actinoplanes toevensis]
MLRTLHTADLTAAERSTIRQMLDLAFAGDFGDDDWDHSLGGLHVIAAEEDDIVAHAAVVQRRFLHGERAWRCGYVEGVAVHPAWRGQGFAAAVMAEVERIVDHGYDLGALSASASGRGLYLRRGWLPWQGRTFVLAPAGPERTAEDDDSTLVRVVPGGAELHLTGALTCDWRDGDVW